MSAPLSPDSLRQRARAVVVADAAAVAAAAGALEDDAFPAAAAALAGCAGKVLVTGSGTSGAVAHRAAHLLSVGGTPAFYLPPADGLHGGLGVLRPDDLVLALSKGGGSAELNEFCRRARRLAGCLVVITADRSSELAGLADHVLAVPVPADADLGSVVATGSSLAAAAVTDALVEVARVIRGYGWEEFFFTHPSGAVGRDAPGTLRRLRSGPGAPPGAASAPPGAGPASP